jgi:hypothetical protein
MDDINFSEGGSYTLDKTGKRVLVERTADNAEPTAPASEAAVAEEAPASTSDSADKAKTE